MFSRRWVMKLIGASVSVGAAGKTPLAAPAAPAPRRSPPLAQPRVVRQRYIGENGIVRYRLEMFVDDGAIPVSQWQFVPEPPLQPASAPYLFEHDEEFNAARRRAQEFAYTENDPLHEWQPALYFKARL